MELAHVNPVGQVVEHPAMKPHPVVDGWHVPPHPFGTAPAQLKPVGHCVVQLDIEPHPNVEGWHVPPHPFGIAPVQVNPAGHCVVQPAIEPHPCVLGGKMVKTADVVAEPQLGSATRNVNVSEMVVVRKG